MKVHDLVQGSDAWHQFRLDHFGASEAAAMLGLSKKVKRNELLHAKHTGLAREFSAWVQSHILDHGHEVEALARPLVEAMIGEELYPVTCSDGKLSASCDGLTLGYEIAFEHKQWNEALAAEVQNLRLPEEHMPQCQQLLMVTGAEKVLFVVSDGTPERWCSIYVQPDPAWFERISAGWAQFEKDLAAYVPPAHAEPAPVGKAPQTLPALHIQVKGEVTASNLAGFKETALAAIRAVNRDLKTDNDFADAALSVKWCEDVESRLAAAKEHILGQTATIDEVFKAIDDISAEARTVRLALNKLVDSRKAEIKAGIISDARKAWDEHVETLEREVAPLKMLFEKLPDFATAAKNKRTLATMQDAVDTELANCKISADATARDWRAKLASYKVAAAGYEFLFADLALLVRKPADDFLLAVKARIDAHKAAEDEKAEKAKQDAAAAQPLPVSPSTAATAAPPPPAVVPIRPTSGGQTLPPSLNLGTICQRLGFVVTAQFLADTLGIPHAATDKSAKLYRESDWPRICAALQNHVGAMYERFAA